jgi:hypothetical protein
MLAAGVMYQRRSPRRWCVVLNDAVNGFTLAKRSRQQPGLLDLVFRLEEACLETLTANAWKVVSFVANRVLVAARDEWRLQHDPVALLQKDISRAWQGCPNPPASPQEDPRFEVIPSDSPDGLFASIWLARISLTELCRGTGLPRSSTAAALREALSLGVMKKVTQRTPRRDWTRSLYGIDWNWVLDAAKKGERRRRSHQRRHDQVPQPNRKDGSPENGLPK